MARAVLVVVVVVVGVGAYLFLHGDEPDIALTGGSMTRALDGTRGDGERFAGRGRVADVYSVENERDEPLRLSGSRAQRRELGRLGIGVRVGYVPIPRQAVLPNRIVRRNLRAQLRTGSAFGSAAPSDHV